MNDDLTERLIDYRALNMRVLAVAMKGAINDWAVYVGAVAGNSHIREWKEVARHGSKQSESVAKALFPNVKGLLYRG